MNAPNRLWLACAALLAASQGCFADTLSAPATVAAPGSPVHTLPPQFGTPKAVNTQTLGARSTVTPSATAFGGFEIRDRADVYILVRGNSLGTLGVTQGFLDAPRARLYTSSGADLLQDTTGRAGFNGCTSGSVFTDPVVNYYAGVRGQPAHSRDSCVAINLAAGVYTFSVTPSVVGVTTNTGTSTPSSGEILFEVILAPN
jgi:hypothetical protein